MAEKPTIAGEQVSQTPRSEGLERRDLLKVAVGAGLAVAAVAVTAASGAENPPPPSNNPLGPVCESLEGAVNSLCPPQPTCVVPAGPALLENQVEITVPIGNDVIVRKTAEPVADVVLRVPFRATGLPRSTLVIIPPPEMFVGSPPGNPAPHDQLPRAGSFARRWGRNPKRAEDQSNAGVATESFLRHTITHWTDRLLVE